MGYSQSQIADGEELPGDCDSEIAGGEAQSADGELAMSKAVWARRRGRGEGSEGSGKLRYELHEFSRIEILNLRFESGRGRLIGWGEVARLRRDGHALLRGQSGNPEAVYQG